MDIDSELESIQEFIDKDNFHAAMNLSISAMNACRRENNQAGVDTFLQLIQSITDKMKRLFGTQAND